MPLLNRYHRMVEKLLRPGTRRRYYYELGRSGIRVIMKEGWRSFWFKAKRRLTGKVAYRHWIVRSEPNEKELDRYRQESLSFHYRPKISIITPVWNTNEKWLRSAIESVLNQVYDNWELCLADGGSTKIMFKRYSPNMPEKSQESR
jgi:hypothetical protein